MATTLMRNPLRTSISMLSGHDIPSDVHIVEDGLPLGYLYATWNPGTPDEVEGQPGHYDPDLQTWVLPDGAPTAGVYTKTRTSGSGCGDCVTDDVCA